VNIDRQCSASATVTASAAMAEGESGTTSTEGIAANEDKAFVWSKLPKDIQ
jgi:hypothetical protein